MSQNAIWNFKAPRDNKLKFRDTNQVIRCLYV
jgi:hypothetical protein